jgi:hypothetical protein
MILLGGLGQPEGDPAGLVDGDHGEADDSRVRRLAAARRFRRW